jgi:putative hydrolase of the HAD superfamily
VPPPPPYNIVRVPRDVILFDADGVVQFPPDDWRDRIAARLDADGAEAETLLAEVLAAEAPAVRGAEDFPQAVAAVLARWDRADRLDEVLSSWHEIEVDHAVVALIQDLRAQGVRCYLATNQQNMRAAYMRKTLDYDDVFDGQYFSCEMGVAKPDPAYFRHILDDLSVPAGRVLFIDDNLPNVDGAREAGIAAEHYERAHGLDALKAIVEQR